MKAALRALLVGAPAVAALVGTRLAWGLRPQGSALPAVTLTRISSRRVYAMEGQAGAVEDRVQVDCWAESAAAVEALAQAVIAAAVAPPPPHALAAIFVDGARDFVEPVDGREPIHRVSIDLMVHHRED